MFPKPIKKIKVKKPLRRVKKTSLGKMTRYADREFSLRVREVGYCELMGKDNIRCGGNLQCMHIITRTNRRLRWDIFNALCGCAGHHRYYTTHPFEFYEIIKRYFPDRYNYVLEHRNEIWDKQYER